MRETAPIIYTQTDRDVAIRAVEDQWHRVRLAEQREEKTAAKADEIRASASKAASVAEKAREQAGEERLELGRLLVAARSTFPIRGSRKGDPFAQTWSAWLESIGLTQQRAHELMQLAGYNDKQSPDESTTGDTSSTTSRASDADDNEDKDDIGQDEEDATSIRQQNTAATAAAGAGGEPKERSGGRGKPAWLMRALVRDYSMQGDLVCDPLAGWGSTLRAALDEGRRAVGSELDHAIAEQAGELPIHRGDWRTSLAHIDKVDAVICDPPYSARTHEASRKFGNAREDGSSLDGLGPEYGAWTRDHVFEFVRSWAPRNRGWFVALTDHNLIHDWQDAYEEAGLYAFAPVVVIIKGMTVRLCGDGPSSEALYAMVARPRSFSRWETLHGVLIGTKTQLEYGATR